MHLTEVKIYNSIYNPGLPDLATKMGVATTLQATHVNGGSSPRFQPSTFSFSYLHTYIIYNDRSIRLSYIPHPIIFLLGST